MRDRNRRPSVAMGHSGDLATPRRPHVPSRYSELSIPLSAFSQQRQVPMVPAVRVIELWRALR